MDSVILRLIRLSIEAAVVPVVAASIKLALVYSFDDNQQLMLCVLLARLYSNVWNFLLYCASNINYQR